EDRVAVAKQEAAAALEAARGVDQEGPGGTRRPRGYLKRACQGGDSKAQHSQIRSMQGKVESERQQLQELRAEVERVQSLWLPRLRSLIVRISKAFSRNFEEMAVAGEVALEAIRAHKPDAERSVSTILYLVSLQDLTRCPFRVVDEINQGMDPTNERNMFQQFVRAATHDHTPQCFLVTPKLLPDLNYGESCTVHCVMNGPHAVPLASTAGFKEGKSLWDSLQQSAADA
ncbi:unnamed protein product, partial [Closterium sp. Naga37s-1]